MESLHSCPPWTLREFAQLKEPEAFEAWWIASAEFKASRLTPQIAFASKRTMRAAYLALIECCRPHFVNGSYRITGYLPHLRTEFELLSSILQDVRYFDFGTSEFTDGAYPSPDVIKGIRISARDEERSLAGRKPTYDWVQLKKHLQTETPVFDSLIGLIEGCRTRVKTRMGGSPPADRPDDKTIRDAIQKYGLNIYIRRLA